MNIVSFGGGTNSTAMIIGMYQRNIPIDMIIFADTGSEKPETYNFVAELRAWLVKNGLPDISIVQTVNKHGEKITLEQDCLLQKGLPGVAYGRPDCATKFKIQPQEKHCNNLEDCKVIWKRGEKIDKYIGFDAGVDQAFAAGEVVFQRRYRHIRSVG